MKKKKPAAAVMLARKGGLSWQAKPMSKKQLAAFRLRGSAQLPKPDKAEEMRIAIRLLLASADEMLVRHAAFEAYLLIATTRAREILAKLGE